MTGVNINSIKTYKMETHQATISVHEKREFNGMTILCESEGKLFIFTTIFVFAITCILIPIKEIYLVRCFYLDLILAIFNAEI